MKSPLSFATASLLILGLVTGVGLAAPADDAKTVAALDTQYQEAVKNNDAATMDHILHDTFVLVVGSGRTFSKADLLKEARTRSTVYAHQEEEAGTQTVRVWGDTAVVTAKLCGAGGVRANCSSRVLKK